MGLRRLRRRIFAILMAPGECWPWGAYVCLGSGLLTLANSDAFAGGFIAGIVEGKSLDESVDMGHWLASLSIKELGPQYVHSVPLDRHMLSFCQSSTKTSSGSKQHQRKINIRLSCSFNSNFVRSQANTVPSSTGILSPSRAISRSRRTSFFP